MANVFVITDHEVQDVASALMHMVGCTWYNQPRYVFAKEDTTVARWWYSLDNHISYEGRNS